MPRFVKGSAMLSWVQNSIRTFARNEDGTATVEAVIWLPTFFYILILSVNVTMIFHGYSRVLRVVEDANRGLSIGRIGTATDAAQAIKDNLPNYWNVRPTVTIDNGLIKTVVKVKTSDMSLLSTMAVFAGSDITIQTQQYLEK